MNFIEKINILRVIENLALRFFWLFFIQKQPFCNAYKEVLKLKSDNKLLPRIGSQEERALPSDVRFLKSGWWKKMIVRYAIATKLSKGKNVLDTCCGIGWGSYLTSQLASNVTGIDNDKSSIDFAKKYWKKSNVDFQVASVLDIPFNDSSFDVVLTMESIEHFTREDGEKYLNECYRVLKENGVLIGSSFFPLLRAEANRMSSANPFHIHVYTKEEITDLLGKTFRKSYVFKSRLYFIAKK